MKRLRYYLWALVMCIEAELLPNTCDAENPNAHEDCIREQCRCLYCISPEGHPTKHANINGSEWQ
jgi:hypothetical protein